MHPSHASGQEKSIDQEEGEREDRDVDGSRREERVTPECPTDRGDEKLIAGKSKIA